MPPWSLKRWETQRVIGLERINSHIDRSPNEKGCWLWTGNRNAKGYGYTRFMGLNWLAHRLAYTLNVGQIPIGLFVCHACDTPACVNPGHLWLGTKGDNNRDMGRKNRAHGKRRPGSANHQAKLTQDDVDDIRFLYYTEAMKQVELAREFHISQAQVSKIVRNESWVATE